MEDSYKEDLYIKINHFVVSISILNWTFVCVIVSVT